MKKCRRQSRHWQHSKFFVPKRTAVEHNVANIYLDRFLELFIYNNDSFKLLR